MLKGCTLKKENQSDNKASNVIDIIPSLSLQFFLSRMSHKSLKNFLRPTEHFQ